jgi:purine-cytosine permease-like protein
MHLRTPSVDKGVQSFVWAVVFFLFMFFGMRAIGVEGATALVLSGVASFVIFLFVRTRGDHRPEDGS